MHAYEEAILFLLALAKRTGDTPAHYGATYLLDQIEAERQELPSGFVELRGATDPVEPGAAE